MPQIKISLDEAHLDFVSQYSEYGFSSKSAIVEAAVAQFKSSLLAARLLKSAECYEEIYQDDLDLQELTDDAAGLCLE